MLMAVFWASRADALTARCWTENVGYTQARFVFDTADPDSAVKKIVVYWGTTNLWSSLSPMDSLTSSITDPDSIAKAAGTFKDGTAYYWYAKIIDSTTTIYWPPDYLTYLPSFTTTDFEQNVSVLYDGYSTAGIMYDSAGVFVAALDSIIMQYWATGDTAADTITTVTYPDTSALTGLEEGVTYTGRAIVWLADSSITDTSAEFTWTTTDLQSTLSLLRASIDSLILILDSVDICPDSYIVQYGFSALTLTQDSAAADTNTSPNCPDTLIFTGIPEGADFFVQIIYFLPDSSAIDTGTVYSYSRSHNKFWENINIVNFWPSTIEHRYLWEFTGAGSYSTGLIPIESPFIRVHAGIDGWDDISPGDSIASYIWSWSHGDSTVIDTIITQDADTGNITPITYMTQPGVLTDSGITYYPLYDWGTHYSISAVEVDTTIYEDSTIGRRTVGFFIENLSRRYHGEQQR